ncbi:unnamed protein product [Moneuplotes crassus]|uniref:Uncharacterized protein n=1 Tax=Euplotes crassus TaxID=5936 RepID=A0AAD1UG46_EUPCR|nr:unnamed protein product [Moneuplotes crassus]
MVYLAFSLITYDRKKTSNKLLLKKMKHKYFAKVNCDQISKLNKNFIISADLADHQLLKVIEADSRNPNLDSIQRVDLKCSRLNSDILKLDRTFSSMLKKPRRVLKQKSHDNINV